MRRINTLTLRQETAVRLIHAHGHLTLDALLSAFRTQTLPAGSARGMLRQLELDGWLDAVHLRRQGAPKQWSLSEDGLACVGFASPLPRNPAVGMTPPVRRAATAAVAREAVTAPAGRVPPRRENRMTGPAYVPERVHVRAGGRDLLSIPSLRNGRRVYWRKEKHDHA